MIDKTTNSDNSVKSKETVSLLLPVEIIDCIEESLFQFRRGLPRELKKKLNRSTLYILILEDILNESKINKESRLHKIINNWQQKITS